LSRCPLPSDEQRLDPVEVDQVPGGRDVRGQVAT
jgi:hypothetical protein